MPAAMEKALMAKAQMMMKKKQLHRKKGDTPKEAKDRFVYGIMRKRGWKPQREKK